MPRPVELPSKETLDRLLRYDPKTGNLFWRTRDLSLFPSERTGATWNSRFANKRAFTAKGANGYLVGAVEGKIRSAHRVIWKMWHGLDPDIIDHINGVRTDNRIENLRSVGWEQNSKNRLFDARNKSGVMGVFWDKTRNKWTVTVGSIMVGRYDDLKTAKCVRMAIEKVLNYHENHGRKA